MLRSPAIMRQGSAVFRGRLLWLVQWAALAAVYYLALRGRVAPPGDRVAALAGALFLRLALGAFGGAVRAGEDRRILAQCRSGRGRGGRGRGRPALPQDGKRFAAVGRLAALGAPLAAPFSGNPCVAYGYRIEGDGSGPAYAGLALAPAVIAAPCGDVRLLGFPRLENGFAEAACGGDAARERARAFVAGTSFLHLDPGRLGRVLAEPPALPADADGSLRRDWRADGLRKEGIEGIEPGDRLAELAVAPGEEVCAIGLYRAAEGGVAPDASPGGRPLRLLRGDADAAAAALAPASRPLALAGLGLLIVPHALLAAFVLLRPR